VVKFLPGSHRDRTEDPLDNLYIALLVRGKDDQLIDALGCAWGLPYSIYDTPERSEIWADHCVDVLKSIVVNSKPRHAIRDATLIMEAAFPKLSGPREVMPLLCAMDEKDPDFVLGGTSTSDFGILSTFFGSRCSELS
jgi:hypothetical protein